MKILIIENFWLSERKLSLFEKLLLNTFSILPTLFARQLAAITPKKHIVKIVDERYSNINFDEKYDIVLINFNLSSIPRAYELANIFKGKKVLVVFSGWYPSVNPKDALAHANSVLIGKNEFAWLELLKDFENGKLKQIYGPKKFDNSIKIPPANIKIPGLVITGAIEATRGCPFKCEFCPESNLPGGEEFYKRPIDEVIDEIKSISQKTIIFYDNSMTIDVNYTKELFKKMIDLKKRFFCNGNSNSLANDLELVKLSKKAGCISWLIGFESVSQETIDYIGKTSNKVKEYKKAVENIHNNNMAVIGSFMFGFDTDKIEVFEQTLKMINELKIDVADFCILTPFPGTPIYEKFEEEKRILTKDWSKYTMKNVVFKPKNMSPEELLFGVKKLYKNYYSTPNTLKRIIRGLNLGIYPVFLVIVRNAIANMNSRRITKP